MQLELADASGEARERLGLELGGLRQVDRAAVQQPGEVAQRGGAAALGVLDRDRHGGDLPVVVRRRGAVFVSIVSALLGR